MKTESDKRVFISGSGSISALGVNIGQVLGSYQSTRSAISLRRIGAQVLPVAALSEEGEEAVIRLRAENPLFEGLDRSVLLSMHACRQACMHAGWKGLMFTGLQVGSSRGATELFEEHHQDFIERKKTRVATSPTTTLGNLSSWSAYALESNNDAPLIEHSCTCSTALQALGSAVAFLRSGMTKRFIVAGTEAPLTEFTVAMMQALRIYSDDLESVYPCRPCRTDSNQNTFVLGEGAAAFALETSSTAALAELEGVGFGRELVSTHTSISESGEALQVAMSSALAQLPDDAEVDLVVLHAPGTIAGDSAELKALESAFRGRKTPALTSNKWRIGHTLGASGAFSLEYALLLLGGLPLRAPDYPTALAGRVSKQTKRVMVNACGFGGSAVSVIVARTTENGRVS